MVEFDAKPTPVEPPRGFHSTRVDDKGRLKLPAPFQKYLSDLGEKMVFVTTLDEATVRIYPSTVWSHNENFFDEAGEDAQAKEDASIVANHYGEDTEVDGQGRVLVPTGLRRELGLENQKVVMRCYKGRIDVSSEEVHKKRFEQARARLAGELVELEKKGLR